MNKITFKGKLFKKCIKYEKNSYRQIKVFAIFSRFRYLPVIYIITTLSTLFNPFRDFSMFANTMKFNYSISYC